MKDLPTPPSDTFFRAFDSNGGSCVKTCDFCKRTYFNSDEPGGFNEGELEALREAASKNPRFIEVDYSVGWAEIEGKSYVWGCACNALSKHEAFIWYHRKEIARYLKDRTQEELSEAKDMADLVSDLDT